MKDIDLIIILLIFFIIIIYLKKNKKNNDNTIKKKNIIQKKPKNKPVLMLNNLVNIDKETNNLLLHENSTSNIKSQAGGSKPYKDIKLNDNNLNLNVINYNNYSSYRKVPKYRDIR